MTRWIDVGAIAELKFNPGAPIEVEGRRIGLFRKDGGFRAIDNLCPHAGAPLCDGSVMNGKVVCFLHCWEFDLETGACDVGKEWAVQTYPVRERDGRLEVQLDG
jgi:nitrite reductase (NADH) small subunit